MICIISKIFVEFFNLFYQKGSSSYWEEKNTSQVFIQGY